MPRLLLVDDEPALLQALRRLLRRLGPDVRLDLAEGGAAALPLLQEHRYDVVISDLRMPGMDGLDLLCRVAQLQPLAVRLLLTGQADFPTAQRAVNETGVFRYLTKPWTDGALLDHVATALRQARQLQEQDEQASAWQASVGLLTPEEIERRRLEAEEPGLLQVEWADDGAVLMPPLDSPLALR